MDEKRYGKVLTVILIVVIVAIFILLGIVVYDYWQKYNTTKEASQFVDEFEKDITVVVDENKDNEENNESQNIGDSNQGSTANSTNTKYSGASTKTYYGFTPLGTISIPKTGVKYPILQEQSPAALNKGVVFIYGVGLNQPGNTVIAGHNYRNGQFFSNNKNLVNGDKIYITDGSGKKLTYTIYNKFETSPDDASFYTKNTNGKIEITLSTCTNDNKRRTIIFARAD